MKTRRVLLVLFAGCVLLLLPGCPPGGFFGRYIVVNDTEENIADLTLADSRDSRVLPVANHGQACVVKQPFSQAFQYTLSWKGELGQLHEVKIDISKKAGYRCKDDLLIELKKGGEVQWRLVPQPQ